MRKILLTCIPASFLCFGCIYYGPHTRTTQTGGITHTENVKGSYQIAFGEKKRKKNIHASLNFIEAVKNYRVKNNHFPQDLWNLENDCDYNRAAFRTMREIGFTSLSIEYLYLDSMVIAFKHDPTSVPYMDGRKGEPIGMTNTGKFIFTYNRDSSSFMYSRKID